MRVLSITTMVVILAILAGIIIMIRGCTAADPSPDFDPFLSSFIGVTSVSHLPADKQQVHFLTDTVFPISDNGDSDSQDIFTTAVVRFAGIQAQATKLSKVDVKEGHTYSHFLNMNDDTPDDTSSNLINYWTVSLPILDNLKNARYLFIVTACTEEEKCQNTPATLCLLNGKIIGYPKYYGRYYASAPGVKIQPSTCDNPVWDESNGDYSDSNSLNKTPHRLPYSIPSDWNAPIGAFNRPPPK